MLNRVTITGKLLDTPKVRTFEARGGTIETVSLWVEVKDDHRADRFTVEINCPKQMAVAKAMRTDVMVEVTGKLRHDRWQDKNTKRWTGKVFVAIDPGEGSVRSQGLAEGAKAA